MRPPKLMPLFALALILATRCHVRAQNVLVIDLIELAPQAKWTSTRGDVTFGEDQYGVTIADYRYNVKMNDGSVVARTLYTPIYAMDTGTDLVGCYSLRLPVARKITLRGQANATQNWLHGMGMECRVPGEGVSVKAYDRDFIEFGHFADGKPMSFESDLTALAGKDVEVLLRTQAHLGSIPGLLHWTQAQVLCELPVAAGYDLALSPSDIGVIPQPDPSRIKLTFLARNAGQAASPPFALMVKRQHDGRELARLRGSSIEPGKSAPLECVLPVPPGTQSPLLLECQVIGDSGAEEVRGNNEACLGLRVPCHGLAIKRIEGLPRPWKADRLKVVFDNRLDAAPGYSLSYRLTDFWGNRLVANRAVKLPRTPRFTSLEVDLKPALAGKLGWFQADLALRYRGTPVSTHSISISRVPPRPAVLSPLMGIQMSFWLNSPEEIRTDLEWVRDLGARYVRCDHGIEHLEELLAQGNGEYVLTYIPQNLLEPIAKGGWTKELEKRCYDETFALASKYRGRVKVYELGNEYNPTISPEDCAKMFKTIYAAAKAADPDCIVNTVGAGGGGPAVVEWYRRLYALAGDAIDNLSLHSYTLFAVPDRDEFLMKQCDQPVEKFVGILKDFGVYPRKNVWITEYGWFATDRRGMDQQAQNTVRQLLFGGRHGIPMIQYFLRDAGYDNSHDGVNTEGISYFNREPKPAFPAYAVMASRLSEARFVEEKDLGANAFLYVFEKHGARFAYLWKSVAPEEVITVPAGGAVKVTDMMGNTRSVPASRDGTVALPVSGYPICVEGLDLGGFAIRERKQAPEVRLEDTPTGAALHTKLKRESDPGAWVWWGIVGKQWRENRSRFVLADYAAKAESYLQSLERPGSETIPGEKLVRCRRLAQVRVDGDLGEWAALPAYEGRNVLSARANAPGRADESDLSYAFRAGWDARHVYLAVEVKDENVHNAQPAANAYTEDAVELWFSPLNSRLPRLGPGDCQYVFGVAGQEYDTNFREAGKSLAKVATRKHAGGYTMEIAIPLSELLLSRLKSGYAIGFELGVDDADAAGKDCQMLWSADSPEVWLRPSLWGSLRFE